MAEPADLRILSRDRLAGDEAERFVAIYEGSFPASERDESASLLASIAAGERRCEVALAGEALVGLAVLLPLRGLPVWYLEYLAIDPSWRSRGIGSRLLGRIREQSLADPDRIEGVVFEVDPPEAATGPERAIRERRISMYTRNGATVVADAPRYRAPVLDGEGTLPFTLMWLPVGDGVPHLEGGRLRSSVAAILTQSYELAEDDPLLAGVVDDLIV